MAIAFPELPYPKDALAPHITAETIEYHYGKHHRAYVDNLNKLIAGSDYDQANLETIILKSDGGIFNNAAQVWNHTFYWNCLTPKSTQEPKGELLDALTESFGNFNKFKDEFTKTCVTTFGSGWGWLVKEKSGGLALLSTSNAQNPLTTGKTPLLTCDVWEHAYYIDYRNQRPKYVEAFWNIVNWDFVARQLSAPPKIPT